MSDDYEEIIIGAKGTPFYELSPAFYCTFSLFGKKWRTLVHYWSAMYFYGNDQMVDWIRNKDTTSMAINSAKKQGFRDFDQVDAKLFIQGVQARFNQSDGLRTILLSTGSSHIIYKGSGGFLMEGNRYGKILMRVREMYQY